VLDVHFSWLMLNFPPCSVTIAAGGVLPNIHSVLLPSSKKGKAKGGSVSQEF
jgi:C-terminus of histone H2A